VTGWTTATNCHIKIETNKQIKRHEKQQKCVINIFYILKKPLEKMFYFSEGQRRGCPHKGIRGGNPNFLGQ